MGKIAEALRANLRELAQADARMLRELDGALPPTPAGQPEVTGKLADGLDGQSLKELKALCKQRELKGYSSLKKPELLQRLRGGPAPLPQKAAATPSGLAAIEARLDRIEALLQRIAAQVGLELEA